MFKKMRRNKTFLELKIVPNALNRSGVGLEQPGRFVTQFHRQSPLIYSHNR